MLIIISAIKNALKQENLNPEIEEKLIQLQRYQEKQMKQEVSPAVPTPAPIVATPTVPAVKAPLVKKRLASESIDSDVPKKKAQKVETKETK